MELNLELLSKDLGSGMKLVSSGRDDWKLLSVLLMFGLAVSLAINVFYAFPSQRIEVAPQSQFVFSWDSNSQKIVNETFVLTLKMRLDNSNLTIVATANDDEYDQFDYLGLVFDTNQNGYIDTNDEPYGLWADNMTTISHLWSHGFLSFTQGKPIKGPQNVTFQSSVGYTFKVEFPYYFYGTDLWDPYLLIKNGLNQMHVIFYDDNASEIYSAMEGVFSTFSFEFTK